MEKIQAGSYAVMNVKMDRLLMSSNADERRPVGYLSKVMTLILVYDALQAGTVSYTHLDVYKRQEWWRGRERRV